MSFIGCATYVSGDLNTDNLSSVDFPFEQVFISETNTIDPDQKIFNEYGRPDQKNETAISKLELDYIIPSDYDGGICSLVTMGTLGIFPCYNNYKGIVKATLVTKGVPILKTEITFRLHVFYGWLALGLFSLIPEENQVGINEGSGIQGAMNGLVRSRLSKRIQKLIEEKEKGEPK